MSRRFEAGDFVLSNCGSLGSSTCVGVAEGRAIGKFKTRKSAIRAICDRMHKDKFYPNTWGVSDHGNVRRIKVKCRVRK